MLGLFNLLKSFYRYKMGLENTNDEKKQLTGYFGYKSYINKHVIAGLRDGRYITGILKSYEHNGDFTLIEAVANTIHNNEYAAEPIGFIVQRGATILFLAMAELSVENYTQVTLEEINEKISQENNNRTTTNK